MVPIACTVKVRRLLPPALWCGVRPGRAAPLAATLFNLFVWDLPQHLREACPGAGVAIGPAPPKVIDLGCADDAGLYGQTSEEL